MPKKGGLGQSIDLRGSLARKRGTVFLRRGGRVDTPMYTMYPQIFNRILEKLRVKNSVMGSFFSIVTVSRFSTLLKRDSVTVTYLRISVNFIKKAKRPIFLRSFY